MEKLNKELLIHNMSVRQASLKHLIDKDITGNTLAFLEAWREVKYWKEALERGEYDVRENVEMNNHKAIFYGERRRVKYNVWGLKELHKYTVHIEYVPIFEIELSNPPLEEQEKVNIDSTDRPVTIINRVRNLDGSYNYYTNRVIETIEDEITKQSKLESEKKVKKWYLFWK